MQVLINNNLFLNIKDIPQEYKYNPKDIIIESYQDILDLNQIKNIKTLNIMGLEDDIKSIDLSNLKELESIRISYNFGLERIEGLSSLSKLRIIYYPRQEKDNYYNLLFTNILTQIDLSTLLTKDSSCLLLSIFSIPILKKRYPDFFNDFWTYSDKISFGDNTETFLQGDVYSTCTFSEALKADAIIDQWITENISTEMSNIEKFAKIYEYVIGIDYDLTANENKEAHKNACSALKTLLRGKGICVGYAQLLKYICLKCDLQCEYVPACLRGNYKVVSDEKNDSLIVIPKEEDKSKLNDFIIPNHAIVRFSPDGINWLFSDPTNDSLFVRIAHEQNKMLKRWSAFCLTHKEMNLYNIPHMYDYNGNKVTLDSQLTPEITTQIRSAENAIFGQNNHGKHL